VLNKKFVCDSKLLCELLIILRSKIKCLIVLNHHIHHAKGVIISSQDDVRVLLCATILKFKRMSSVETYEEKAELKSTFIYFPTYCLFSVRQCGLIEP